jgi:hypothetical protein
LAQFVAFTEEFGVEFSVVDLPFWPFGRGFEAFRHDATCTVPGRGRRGRQSWLLSVFAQLLRPPGRFQPLLLQKVQRHLHRDLAGWLESRASTSPQGRILIGDTVAEPYAHLRATRYDFLYLDAPEVLADFRSRPETIICGPKVRCWSLFKKHHKAVRQRLRIRREIAAKAEAHVTDLRQRYDFLIGVLLRQGDYRTHREGIYYFSTQQYVRWMVQALAAYSDRGRVGFLVTSDEAQDPALFAGLPYAFATGCAGGPGHYLESLAGLGLCDRVMTTASSFGCWGAFIGGVPVLPLTCANQVINPENEIPGLWECTQHADLQPAIW